MVLGHIILRDGIEVDKAKTDFIANLPPPVGLKVGMPFLRHAGSYHCFIK